MSELARMEPALDVRGAAAYLGIHIVTVRKLARAGEIPCRKVGKYWKFDPDALRGYISGTKQEEQWPLQETQNLESTMETGTSTEKEYAALLGRK